MSDPYIGEIKYFGFPYAPVNWAAANGASLAIRQSTNLFALLGTQFGGDGVTNFRLPNLASRNIVGTGNGPGLTPRQMGAAFGTADVTLNVTNLPPHNHTFQSFFGRNVGRVSVPAAGNALGNASAGNPFNSSSPNAALGASAVTSVGNSEAHSNMQPMLGINPNIALMGLWPDWD